MYTTFSALSLFVLMLIMIAFFTMKRDRKPPFIILPMLLTLGVFLQYLGMRYDGSDPVRIRIIQSVFNSVKMISADFRHEPVASLLNDNMLYFISLFFVHIAVLFYAVYYLIAFVSLKTTNWFRIQISRLFVHYIVMGDEQNLKAFLLSLNHRCRVTVLMPLNKHEDEEAIYENYVNLNPSVKLAFLFKPTNYHVFRRQVVPRSKKTLHILSLYNEDSLNLKVIHAVSLLSNLKHSDFIKLHTFYENFENLDDIAYVNQAKCNIKAFNIYDLSTKYFLSNYPFTKIIKPFINPETAKIKPHTYNYHLIGFGKQNQTLLKQLLMMNQFNQTLHYYVYTRHKSMHYERFIKPLRVFHQSQVNTNMLADLKEYYTDQHYPAPKHIGHLSFSDIDVMGLSFNKKIKDKITEKEDVNILIISLGNDSLNMHTARSLRQFLIDENLEINTRIFVKIKDEKYFEDIQSSTLPIVPFGQLSTVLTHDNIVDENLDHLAKATHYHYNQKSSNPMAWNTLKTDMQQSNRMAVMHLRTKLNLIGLDLVKGQPDESIRALFWQQYDPNGYAFKDFEPEKDLRTYYGEQASSPRYQIAIYEHLRWNVYHFLLGYVPMKKQTFIANLNAASKKKKTSDIDLGKHNHVCLTSIEGLFDIAKTMKEQGLSNSNIDFFKYDFTLLDSLVDILLDNPWLGLTIKKMG